jgi:hypothetical protein
VRSQFPEDSIQGSQGLFTLRIRGREAKLQPPSDVSANGQLFLRLTVNATIGTLTSALALTLYSIEGENYKREKGSMVQRGSFRSVARADAYGLTRSDVPELRFRSFVSLGAVFSFHCFGGPAFVA